MRKDKITLEKHIKMANDMTAADHYLTKIGARCEKYYPPARKVMKVLEKIKNDFNELQEALTAEFHRTVQRKDLKPEEEIYKNLPQRYKNIRNSKK